MIPREGKTDSYRAFPHLRVHCSPAHPGHCVLRACGDISPGRYGRCVAPRAKLGAIPGRFLEQVLQRTSSMEVSGQLRDDLSSEILQMNPKPASMFAFPRPSCKTDARC